MTAHSPLGIGPSSLPLIALCPGSVAMQRGIPNEPSDDTRNGEAAHFAFSEQLLDRVVAEGQIAPNGVMLTAEMLDAADLAVEYVRRRSGGANLMVEHRVYAKRIHPECFGTLDAGCWLLPPATRRPTVFLPDFKFGHRFVDAYENAQLIAYACGVVEATGYADDQVDLILAIVQPRSYGRGGVIREWAVPLAEIRGQINKISASVHRALEPSAPCIPNDSCCDCRGRHACVALQKDAYRSAAFSDAAVPFNLPPAAAALELRFLRSARARLEARESGLEEQLEAQIKQGMRVPWWRLGSSEGREVWRDPAAALELGSLYDVSMIAPDKPITPNQARKLGIDASVVAAMAHRPGGKLGLLPDEGGTSLARVFGAETASDEACGVCGEIQFPTPSGATCKNGHGGA